MGLLTGMIVAPRVAFRFIKWSKVRLPEIAGTGPIEHKAAAGSHMFIWFYDNHACFWYRHGILRRKRIAIF